MLPIIEKLLVLQDRDRRLLRLRAELATVPGQRKLLETRSQQAQVQFETVKRQSQQIESDRKKLELEVETLQERIGKVRAQQNDTRSNDQYKAYQHQIETTEGEIRALEDRELDLMERGEKAAADLKTATQTAAQQKAESDRQLADLAAREKNLQAELSNALAQREQAATDVDEPTRNRYERVLKSKGENVIVGIAKGICGGCHMKLTTQVCVTTKGHQEIVNCPNCGRLLYHTRDMDAD
jgi:uncharacterized protein